MTMLIDTRDSGDHGEPVWEPDWAMWRRGTMAAALGIAAFLTAGTVSLLAMLAAFYFAGGMIERALPYHHGLGEYRQ